MSGSSALSTDKSIVLIGFMGAGKSTVGQVVATKLERPFVDVDTEIERKYGMSVQEMFESQGEARFREIEQQVTVDFCKTKGQVISLGGGAFLNEKIREVSLRECIVFYLSVSWETWKSERFDKIRDTRPVLQGLDLVQVKDLFTWRVSIYEGHHHYKVSLDSLGVDEAADEIAQCIQ